MKNEILIEKPTAEPSPSRLAATIREIPVYDIKNFLKRTMAKRNALDAALTRQKNCN